MQPLHSGATEQDVDRGLEQYREAAERALAQLEWCIDYLYRLRLPDIARALPRNRKQILECVRQPHNT
jgi:hypothetical protein